MIKYSFLWNVYIKVKSLEHDKLVEIINWSNVPVVAFKLIVFSDTSWTLTSLEKSSTWIWISTEIWPFQFCLNLFLPDTILGNFFILFWNTLTLNYGIGFLMPNFFLTVVHRSRSTGVTMTMWLEHCHIWK